MNHSKIYMGLIGSLLTAALLLMNSSKAEMSDRPYKNIDNHKVFELRTYTTHDGKLDDLHERFANHTMEIFEKHGMHNIGYWTPVDKGNTLTYIISHESREAAEASWQAFLDDPEWQEVAAKSREDGPVVSNVESVFMSATEYSPIK